MILKKRDDVSVKDVNRLTVCRNDYQSNKDFRNAVKKAVMALLDNDNIMTVKYDCCDKDMGVVIIDFNPADESYGFDYPHWLSPEEFESIVSEEYV